MENKGILRDIYERVMGVPLPPPSEQPKTRDEKIKEKLEGSGLVTLKEISKKQEYNIRFIVMLDALCRECPALDDNDPDYKTKKVIGADDDKLKKNYEFLKECDENFEEVAKLMLETKSGDLHNLAFSLCAALQTYACYFDREHDSYHILKDNLGRYKQIAMKIEEDEK